MLASLVGFLGHVDVAEDAAQQAFAIAAERWGRDGEPDNPRAWLVARNRAIDRLRRDRTLAAKTHLLEVREAVEDDVDEHAIPAERLEIVERLKLDGYRYLHSTRAELLRRLGRRDDARASYRRALELARDERERRFLERRLAAL